MQFFSDKRKFKNTSCIPFITCHIMTYVRENNLIVLKILYTIFK